MKSKSGIAVVAKNADIEKLKRSDVIDYTGSAILLVSNQSSINIYL